MESQASSNIGYMSAAKMSQIVSGLRCARVVEAGGLSVSEARPRLPGAECHWSALATPSNFASVMYKLPR